MQGEGDKAAIAHPSFVNDADPNYGRNWTFAEFTLNSTQLYANISYVDFVAAPIGLKLDHGGGTQEAGGQVIRILNPNHRAADGGELVFGAERFGRPTSADIWGCNSGPFANNPGSDSEQRKAIVPRLAAAFNRTTLLINHQQPHGERPETFYQHPITNHYARVVHENLPDGRGYAFAYDDVSANPDEDHSGKVNHHDPHLLTVTLNRLR